jgi:hypothetical protein
VSELSPDDFIYALENARMVQAPSRRLSTFGTSILNYHLVTEDMDSVNLSRVREGSITAERPQILSPDQLAKLTLEGFGEKGQQFGDFINQNAQRYAVLKYGFRIRKDEIRSYDVHESLETVLGRVCQEVKEKNDPLAAVLSGIDEGWEVCLLKFMFDMVVASSGENLGDFRDRGLL